MTCPVSLTENKKCLEGRGRPYVGSISAVLLGPVYVEERGLISRNSGW